MPRDPEKMSRNDLAEEVREKHGGETVPVEVEQPEGFEPADTPVDGTVILDGDRELTIRVEQPADDDEEPTVRFYERVSVEEAPKAAILAEFGPLLDTTTEKEREKAARELAQRENEEAEKAAGERKRRAAEREDAGDDEG